MTISAIAATTIAGATAAAPAAASQVHQNELVPYFVLTTLLLGHWMPKAGFAVPGAGVDRPAMEASRNAA